MVKYAHKEVKKCINESESFFLNMAMKEVENAWYKALHADCGYMVYNAACLAFGWLQKMYTFKTTGRVASGLFFRKGCCHEGSAEPLCCVKCDCDDGFWMSARAAEGGGVLACCCARLTASLPAGFPRPLNCKARSPAVAARSTMLSHK